MAKKYLTEAEVALIKKAFEEAQNEPVDETQAKYFDFMVNTALKLKDQEAKEKEARSKRFQSIIDIGGKVLLGFTTLGAAVVTAKGSIETAKIAQETMRIAIDYELGENQVFTSDVTKALAKSTPNKLR